MQRGGNFPCCARSYANSATRLRCAAVARRGVLPLCRHGPGPVFRGGAVGGVKIDVDGVVSNPASRRTEGTAGRLAAGLQQVPADLRKADRPAIRFAEAVWNPKSPPRANAGKPLPDAVRFLAGLQRVRYVLVYPEQARHRARRAGRRLASRSLGNVVGTTTGRPVLTLDDLMVALRVAESSNASGISCSIDPTPEGLQRDAATLPAALARTAARKSPRRQMEEAVGPQTITVTGMPATSHFARVIVAADFRMKRLAMDFEPAPVDGMPSFLTCSQPPRGSQQHDAALVARAELRTAPPRRRRPGLGTPRPGREVPDRSRTSSTTPARNSTPARPTRPPRNGPTRSPRSSTSWPAKIRASANCAT